MHAQSDLDVPTFRPRTDFNAKRDLQLLREALNRAGDVNGAINPLGEYIERNSEVVQAEMKSRLEIGQSDKEADKVDKEVDKVDKEAIK